MVGSSEAVFSSVLELRDASGAPADKFSVGDPVELVLRVHNRSETPQKVTLPTAQVFDFEVTDPADTGRVWHWSHDRLFATVLTEVAFDAGETKEFSVVWDRTTDTGGSVPEGKYEAVGLVNGPEPGLRSGAVPFSIR